MRDDTTAMRHDTAAMRDETIARFLGQLAARVPAPGGGATAALHAAVAAALLGMVARYSDGPRYDARVTGHIRAAADELMDEALSLADADASAFGAVTDAYRLPKETQQQQAERSAAIAGALAGAGRPPAGVLAAALRLTGLAEDLLPAANRNVISDVAAAAEAARAAAVMARVNIEVNLRGIKDPAIRGDLQATAATADDIAARADRVVAAVRQEIGR